MRDLRGDGSQYLVQRYATMLAALGLLLDERSRILDFGCGGGSLVYAFRDLGFDAHGFDMYDFPTLRQENDRDHFRVLVKEARDQLDFNADWSQFRLPYPDDYFDVVVSTEVFEHVQNHDAVLRELARVMKPNSAGIHTFPSRWRFIEPHINIPFGTVLKSYAYYRFWTQLGVRNQYFKGCGADRTASAFYKYAKTALNYQPLSKLLEIGARYFTSQRLAPELWEMPGRPGPWLLPRRLARWWYTRTNHVVWILRKGA